MCIRDRGDTLSAISYLQQTIDRKPIKAQRARLYYLLGPVSYTHLDVYKRQGYALGYAEPIERTIRKAFIDHEKDL